MASNSQEEKLVNQIADGVTETDEGDLLLEDGTKIPAASRTKCEVYSRVVGYLRPVNLWNKGKRAEWADRVVFEAANAVDKHLTMKEARGEE